MNKRVYIDLMGIGDGRYTPIYERLIRKFGEANALASTAHDCYMDKYKERISMILNIRELDDIKIEMEYSQRYSPIDQTLINEMSPYQHIIITTLMRNTKFTTYLSRINHYYNYLRFFNGLIDDYNIGLFFAEAVPHEFYGVLMYYLCKVKGVQTLIYSDSGIRDGYSFVADNVHADFECGNMWTDYREDAYSLLNPHFKAVLDDYMNPERDITPKHDTKEANIKADQEAQKHIPHFFRRVLMSGAFAFHVTFHSSNSSRIQKLRRQINTWDYLNTYKEALKFYNKNVSDYDHKAKYIYVPLHMQPEQTTVPMAGIYENQLLYIKMLSQTIPDDWLLYVKEHPGQYQIPEGFPNFRDANYYKELLSIDKVRLISLNISTFELERNCICVATATGTAGFEAIFRNKQVLVFGGIVYKYAPGAYIINSLEDCRLAIKDIGKNHMTYKTSKEKMANWLYQLQRICYYRGESIEAFLNDSILQDRAFELLDRRIKSEE